MDLKFSAEDEAFRLEVREWVEANLPDEIRNNPSLRNNASREVRGRYFSALRERGWMCASWPKESGGAGFTPAQQVIFTEELSRAGTPPIDIGVVMAGPLIIEYGTEAQKKRFLPRIIDGSEVWCQGYSEPNAGSDLAALSLSAIVDGDDFILNGQKIWTSMATESDWMFLLARTDASAERRQVGISVLFMDMRSPGIDVRPIRQMTGELDFCEVFIKDVRVPRANMLGEMNDGWTYAKRLLVHERISSYTNYPLRRMWTRLLEYERGQAMVASADGSDATAGGQAPARPDGASDNASASPPIRDTEIRRRMARAAMEADAVILTGYRVATKMLRGETPGPESTLIKLFASESMQRLAAIAVDIQGPRAQLWLDENFPKADTDWPMVEASGRSLSIARGTSEIQRNIIAERVLGMPR